MAIYDKDLNLTVLIPVFNENDNLEALTNRILENLRGMTFEILYINDGSFDNSKQTLSNLKKLHPEVRFINHNRNLGIAQAWWSGIKLAKGELVCLIDGDLQNPPEYIEQFISILRENNIDAVQGVRSSIGRTFNHRYIFSRILNTILNLVFGQRARDSKSGFILSYRKSLLEVLKPIDGIRFQQTFIGVALRRANFNVIEVDTFFNERLNGESFLSGFRSFNASLVTFMDIYRYKKALKKRLPSAEYLLKFKDELKFHNQSVMERLLFYIYFLTFPLHTWVISRKVKKYYFALKATEFLSKVELEKLQLDRLKLLIEHVYRTVPYYKTLMVENGLKPENISNLKDINLLPLLTKDDVRGNIHFRLFSTSHHKKQLHKISTSGSTGQPFVCYADQTQLEIRFATTIRAYEMAGWRFGDKQTRLWHQKIGMSPYMVFKEKFDAILMRRTFVPAFEMTEESVSDLISNFNKRKPVILDGYAESLNFLSQTHAKITHSPRAIISSAQQLTDETRERIQQKFRTRVIDKYGSREFSGIAYECPEGIYHHVQDESYIVEILVEGRPAKPGEIGEIVVTDLNNFSVPLIRYRIGDLAQAVEQLNCPCGRSHTLIGKIIGRTQALIYCSNGVWLPGSFFAHFFKDFSHLIKHYQVFQDSKELFTIKVVPTEMFNSKTEKEIFDKLKLYIGNTKVNIILVKEINLLLTGKRTPVISKLNYEFQSIKNSDLKGN